MNELKRLREPTRSPKQKRKPDWRAEWRKLYREVGLYFDFEPDMKGHDPAAVHVHGDPVPPTYAQGVSYHEMRTVYLRLLEADRLMPFRGASYEGWVRPIGKPGVAQLKRKVDDGAPSASMVLRVAYRSGQLAKHGWGPGDGELLNRAQRAYVEAGRRIPKQRPTPAAHLLKRRLEAIMARRGALMGVDVATCTRLASITRDATAWRRSG